MELLAKHVLTMSPEYVLSWRLWESARELLQNSIDRHTTNPESKVVFMFDRHEELLTIGATNCELARRTLLLGNSDKRSQRDTIGQFGEGYKLAMLALTRDSFGVVVRTGSEVWIPKFEYSDEFESSVLTVSVYRAENHANGVFFDVGGVKDQTDDSAVEFGQITSRYLPDYPLNCILDEDHLRKKVFVSGLFVCEIQSLEYGYNFSPDRLRLERDRSIANSYDVAFQTSRLWDDHGDSEKVYDLASKGAFDTTYVRFHKPTTNAYVLERYLEETPDAIPVATDEEAQRLIKTGHTVRRVPSGLRDALRQMHEFVFQSAGTPTERIERFSHLYSHRLDPDGKRELARILKASKYWHGPPEGCEDETEEDTEK